MLFRSEALCESLRVPVECRDLAVLAARHGEAAARAHRLAPRDLLGLLEACDAFRRPQRLAELMDVAEAECYGTRHWADIPFLPRHATRTALGAARHVDAASLAAAGGDIGARIRAARYANVLQTLGGARPR